VCACLALAGAIQTPAQSVDALLNKLVEKGILTVQEAGELRKETDQDFTKAYQARSGLPDWVTAFKINGDFRGRFAGFYGDNPLFQDRNRWRYRARLGFTAVLLDDFEVGLRLGSGEPIKGQENLGGNPLGGSTTFNNNASMKFIYLDLAYGKWTAIHSADWTVAATIGKMESPFAFSYMVLDPDYTPEGGALQVSYNLTDRHALRLNSGAFMIKEFDVSSDDPYWAGVQARADSKWSRRLGTSAGISFLSISHVDRLSNDAVPNVNRGNTRVLPPGTTNIAKAVPQYAFNPIVADASLTYSLDNFPFYAGPFPIRVAGDYICNPAAPHSADNYGYSAGIVFGKSGKKNTWELSYTWRWLGANAWWEELVDSDFGAFYPVALANSDAGEGYGSGTDIQGHIIRLAYSPGDHLTLSARLFITDLISTRDLPPPLPTTGSRKMNRLQLDASLKF